MKAFIEILVIFDDWLNFNQSSKKKVEISINSTFNEKYFQSNEYSPSELTLIEGAGCVESRAKSELREAALVT